MLDWGGQGPANMPSGNNCYQLGTDKCAQITKKTDEVKTESYPLDMTKGTEAPVQSDEGLSNIHGHYVLALYSAGFVTTIPSNQTHYYENIALHYYSNDIL